MNFKDYYIMYTDTYRDLLYNEYIYYIVLTYISYISSYTLYTVYITTVYN